MNLPQSIRRYLRRRATRARRRDSVARRAGCFETLEARCVLSAYNPSLEVPDAQTLFEGQSFDLTTIFQDADPRDIYSATIDWGDGHVESGSIDTSSVFNSPLSVRIDYSLDVNNFFDTQEKRDTLQLAADTLVSRFADTLSAIIPGPAGSLTNTWDAILTHPGAGTQITLTDLSIASNELLVFAGGRNLEAPSLGAGGFGGFNSSGTQAFVDAVKTRGEVGAAAQGAETDFGPWGGSISFTTRSGVNWHFGETTEGLGSGETDFFTVAMHEMGHLLGFGTAPSWNNQIDAINDEFDGPISIAEYDEDGSPPVNSTADHWAEGTEDNDLETSMDPTIGTNTRKLFTPLDYAAMDDIGWTVAPERQGSVSGGHTYADNGVYTISVTLTDDGGGEVTETIEVTVDNVNPTVSTGSNESVHAFDVLSITNIATFTDLGFSNPLDSPPTIESFTYTINWGDGNSDNGAATVDSLGGPNSPTAGSLNGSHTYLAPDTYIVTVTVTDDDGGFDAETLLVEVFAAVEAVDDEFMTDEDSALIVPAGGVLNNDDGSPLLVTAVAGAPGDVGAPVVLPSGATVTLDANGELNYDPRTSATLNALGDGETFDDSFAYTISDGRGEFSTATVSIEVSGNNETAKSVRVDPRLVLSPTATDGSGHAATLPESAEWIDEWREFWVEIWIRVNDSELTGVSSVMTGVAYESEFFTAISVHGGAAFDDGFNATVNDTLGTINITAAASLESLAGADRFALLARVKLSATSDKPGVPINLNAADSVRAVQEGWISLPLPAEIDLAGSVEVADLQQSEFSTELWPVLYDLDDDQRVGFGDLSLFSGVFLQNVFSAPPVARKADFDLSGTVDFGDMSLLSANFLRTRDSGSAVVFPTGFPELWRTAPLPASAASPPSEQALLRAETSPAEEGDSANSSPSQAAQSRLAGERESVFGNRGLRPAPPAASGGSAGAFTSDANGSGATVNTKRIASERPQFQLSSPSKKGSRQQKTTELWTDDDQDRWNEILDAFYRGLGENWLGNQIR